MEGSIDTVFCKLATLQQSAVAIWTLSASVSKVNCIMWGLPEWSGNGKARIESMTIASDVDLEVLGIAEVEVQDLQGMIDYNYLISDAEEAVRILKFSRGTWKRSSQISMKKSTAVSLFVSLYL